MEALKKLDEWRAQRKTIKGEGITWFTFKAKYLEWAYANKSKNTAYRDKLSMEYLEEFCAGKKILLKFITDVSPRLLDDFKTYMKLKSDGGVTHNWSRKKERGVMGNEGINRTLQSLKVIMRKAADWDYISDNIKWNKIKKFRTPRGRVEFFTTEEVFLLLKQAGKLAKANKNKYSAWTTVILLGARAGLRRGEIQNLKWEDINFETNILSVTPKSDWHPKDFECRDIPMSADLREHLLKMPRRGDYVIYDRYGYRFSINCLTTYFSAKIVNRVGLKGNIHKLRHTFASHLVQNRVSLYEVRDLLGHSSITTTEIYAHLSKNSLHSAISMLPEIDMPMAAG
jgi:integrase